MYVVHSYMKLASLQLQYFLVNFFHIFHASSLNFVLRTQYTRILIAELTTKNKWLKHMTTKDQAGNGWLPALKVYICLLQGVST